MGVGGVSKKLASNLSADLQGIFKGAKNIPLLGWRGSKVEKAASTWMEDLKTVKSAVMGEDEVAAKAYDSASEAIEQGVSDFAKTSGKDESEIMDAIRNGKHGDIGMDDATALHLKGQMDGMDAHDQKVADALTGSVTGVGSIAKNYLLGGSPISTYAKVAVPYVGYQMATGQRESLTQKNGQRDIAGIPFV